MGVFFYTFAGMKEIGQVTITLSGIFVRRCRSNGFFCNRQPDVAAYIGMYVSFVTFRLECFAYLLFDQPFCKLVWVTLLALSLPLPSARLRPAVILIPL